MILVSQYRLIHKIDCLSSTVACVVHVLSCELKLAST